MNNRGRNIIKAMISPYRRTVVWRRPLKDERKGILDLILKQSNYWTPYISIGSGQYIVNAQQTLVYDDEMKKIGYQWTKNEDLVYKLIYNKR